MGEKPGEGRRKVNIVATIRIPKKVRITYDVTDEENIMPILEQILDQRRRSLEVTTSDDGSENKPVPRPAPRSMKLQVKKVPPRARPAPKKPTNVKLKKIN